MHLKEPIKPFITFRGHETFAVEIQSVFNEENMMVHTIGFQNYNEVITRLMFN